ncbi:MAG: hypothetical protein EOP84_33735 [Verrucomicrobiaceae bacterium]|nr:MAG: hypothetical protein EOP84_33735 [Verrucomicrobiaceae bacterium]
MYMFGEAFVCITVEGRDRAEVESVLRECLGLKGDLSEASVLGFHVSVEDLSAELAYTRAFLRTHRIVDELNDAWGLDLDAFVVEVQIFGQRECFGKEMDAVLGDQLGRALSVRLSCRTLVSLQGGEVLLRAYDRGVMIRDLRERYASFLAGSSWLPAGGLSK